MAPPLHTNTLLWGVAASVSFWIVGSGRGFVQATNSHGPSITMFQPRGPLVVRGGARNPSNNGKKRTSKRKKKAPSEDKKVIVDAMREKDAATALGDAIRERAHILKSDSESPLVTRIDQSVSSVGFAMGASDQQIQQDDDYYDGGGVEAAPTSVLANYFLKSHGGAHAIQCACSLLALLSTIGALLLPPSSAMLRLMLMKRSMLFAMTKHISGLLAATSMAATAIPEVGLRQARTWIEKLAKDPVSQYVFYSAMIMLWLPTSTDTWWWQSPLIGRFVPFILVGPILLREAVSTAFVISDILVLLTTSGNGGGMEGAPRILKIGHSFMNAGMSLLVTPSVWRNADAPARQAILAKLTSRTSLALEVLVGALLSVDALVALWEFSFEPVGAARRPSMTTLGKRILCARLYLNFLWVRRRKIVKLGTAIRGGASQVPVRVLDILLEPKASMGLTDTPKEEVQYNWKDYIIMGLGLDE